MLDNVRLETLSCSPDTKVVANATIPGPLAPGDEYTIQLTWSNASIGHHCLIADADLPNDVNPANDYCHVNVRVSSYKDAYKFQSIDLTGEGTCLWHICTTREGGDDRYAWAGVEEEQWAHYVHDMDDSFISPPINLSMCTNGAALNFTTWYEFYGTDDFGKVYVRKSPADPWVRLAAYFGSSGGKFIQQSIPVPPEYCSDKTQFCFRMVSDPADTGYFAVNDVSEGWYIDDVAVVNLTALTPGAKCDFSQYDLGTSLVPYSDINQGFWCYDEMDCITEPVIIDTLKVYGLEVMQDNPFAETFVIRTCTAEDESGPYHEVTAVPSDARVVDVLWGTYNVWEITFTGLGLPADPTYKYLCVADNNPSTLFAWMPEIAGTHDDHSYQVNNAPRPFDMSWYFELPPEMGYGEVIWQDDFERDYIAPWTCMHSVGGDYWHYEKEPETTPNGEGDYDYDPVHPETLGWWECSGYPAEGTAINDVLWTKIDLTDEELTYARLHFAMDYDFKTEEAFIEISTDWEPGTPMKDATWITYWHHTPGDRYGLNTSGWVSIDDLVGDDRFVLNQYLGQVIYLRFRLVTHGEGAPVGKGWAIDGFRLEYRKVPIPDTEPPVTTLYFDPETGQVSLVAYDLPLDKNSGVKATYYRLDGGDVMLYTEPFVIPEGRHTIEYWSVDNAGNEESPHKTKELLFDKTPPTVEIVEPKEGWLYLFGSPIVKRIIGKETLCIGKVPIAAVADDRDGSGVKMVLFTMDNETAYDDTPDEEGKYTYTYRHFHIGSLTIRVVAIDNVGLMSEPKEIKVKVFCLGLF